MGYPYGYVSEVPSRADSRWVVKPIELFTAVPLAGVVLCSCHLYSPRALRVSRLRSVEQPDPIWSVGNELANLEPM